MRATFRNASAGEYEQPEGTAAGTAPTRRCVYASWHPDDLEQTIYWIKQFKLRIETQDFICLVHDKVEKAGERVATDREAIQQRLKDVTDFVMVWTPTYYVHQKQLNDLSELSWMIQSTPAASRRAIWVATLEQNFGFKRLRLGDIDLESQSGRWHPTKSESNLLDAYNFPSRDDKQEIARFLAELNAAVERISNHNEGCGICGKPRGT